MDAPALIGVRKGRREPDGNGVEFFLHQSDIRIGPKSSKHGECVIFTGCELFFGWNERSPELEIGEESKLLLRWHDADDRAGLAIDYQVLSNGACITAEPFTPERVTNKDGMAAGLHVG
jgi:hypothetical protein